MLDHDRDRVEEETKRGGVRVEGSGQVVRQVLVENGRIVKSLRLATIDYDDGRMR